MLEQPRLFYNKWTTDSDSECSYVANLVDFNVIRVIEIVTKSNNSIYSNNRNSNNYSHNSKKSNNMQTLS